MHVAVTAEAPLTCIMDCDIFQIMESGAAPLTALLRPSDADADWKAFVALVPECANAAPGNTFACLRSASADQIVAAVPQDPANLYKPLVFYPCLDGPGGIFPDKAVNLYQQGHFAHIPFISGNNKDEGWPSSSPHENPLSVLVSTGTLFADPSIVNDTGVKNFIYGAFDLQERPPPVQQEITNGLLERYPNIAALGSPYDTGNNTFGLSSEWKRTAALYGDIVFQADRRALFRAAVRDGVKSYGYLYTEHNAGVPASLGGKLSFYLISCMLLTSASNRSSDSVSRQRASIHLPPN